MMKIRLSINGELSKMTPVSGLRSGASGQHRQQHDDDRRRRAAP